MSISRQWITLESPKIFSPDTGNVNLLFGIYRCKNSSSGGNETLFAGDVRRDEDEYTKIFPAVLLLAVLCLTVFPDFSYGSWSCGSKDSCQRGIVR